MRKPLELPAAMASRLSISPSEREKEYRLPLFPTLHPFRRIYKSKYRNPDRSVRRAYNLFLPEQHWIESKAVGRQIDYVLENGIEHALALLVHNPNMSPDQLERLWEQKVFNPEDLMVEDKETLHLFFSNHPNLRTKFLYSLAESNPFSLVLQELILHPNTNDETKVLARLRLDDGREPEYNNLGRLYYTQNRSQYVISEIRELIALLTGREIQYPWS